MMVLAPRDSRIEKLAISSAHLLLEQSLFFISEKLRWGSHLLLHLLLICPKVADGADEQMVFPPNHVNNCAPFQIVRPLLR